MTLTRSMVRDAVTTALDTRLMFMALLVANADGSPRPGVIGGANPSIVRTLGTMNVAIDAAEFSTTKGKADGSAVFVNDGTVNVPIATAPTSNSRIDVIYVKHNDNTTGDGDALPKFAVATGVAGATPAKPVIPTGALELATLRVYSGTTATNGGSNQLDNTYQMTAGRGGVVYFRSLVALNLWLNPVGGQEAFVLESGGRYVYLTGYGWTTAADSVFGNAGAIFGSASVGAPLLVQTGNQALSTDTAGNSRIDFPKAFPNAFLGISIIDGDPNASAGQRNFSIYGGSASTNLSSARVAVRSDTGAPIPNVLVRHMWIAYGC